MKLEEAIEILAVLENEPSVPKGSDRWDAVKLGIEALKHCRDIHHMSYEDLHILLPGETTE